MSFLGLLQSLQEEVPWICTTFESTTARSTRRVDASTMLTMKQLTSPSKYTKQPYQYSTTSKVACYIRITYLLTFEVYGAGHATFYAFLEAYYVQQLQHSLVNKVLQHALYQCKSSNVLRHCNRNSKPWI